MQKNNAYDKIKITKTKEGGKMNYVIFNKLSNNKKGELTANALIEKIGESKKISALGLNFTEFLSGLADSDKVYLVGGDGTLNYFINDVYGVDIKPSVYFCPAGSGNDFVNDVKDDLNGGVIDLKKYIKDLPTVYVNGMEKKFINGIGYGLDGVCCEVGDLQRAKSDKPVNYTSIAIKLCLYAYKPRNATVIVDGKEYYFKKVWIAPTMKGRYYGGGMKVAPRQNRFAEDKKVTFVAVFGGSRLKILTTFPKIFSGEHEGKSIVTMLEGKEITVKFDKPCALQVDGETVLKVSEYTVKA